MAIAFPLFSRTLKVPRSRVKQGIEVYHRGLRIVFSRDPDLLYSRQLQSGKIKFVAFPDRLELHLIEETGANRILGRTILGPAGTLLVDGQPIRDRNGLIKCGPNCQRRRVSASMIFPEYGKIKRANHYFNGTTNARIPFRDLMFYLPIDVNNCHGIAAREKRIMMVANHRSIEFLERTREGIEIHIGTVQIDDEGYILSAAGRYVKDGAFINIHSPQGKRNISVSAVDLVENFRIQDVPVRFMESRKRASVEYNCIHFIFNGGKGNAHLKDIAEGVVFMRIGYQDRLEVIRKGSGPVEILGTVRIDKDGFLMDAAGARYNPKKGPVRLGEYRAVNIARLVGAFRTDEGAKIRERQAIASALIWKYRYLVDVFARKYVGQGASEDELEDAGWEGLHKASLKYDETRGFTFRTYARRWIKSEMQLAIFKKKREIWGGEGRARLIRTVRREELRFKQKNGYDPSDAELAERLGLTEKHVVSLRQSAARRVYSLQAPKNGNGDFLWIDSLPDVSVVDPERKAIAREAHAKIEAALGTLDPRASFILKAHYGDEELSLEKIGEILGEAERGEPLTKEGIRQIEERALRRVRENYPTLASYL